MLVGYRSHVGESLHLAGIATAHLCTHTPMLPSALLQQLDLRPHAHHTPYLPWSPPNPQGDAPCLSTRARAHRRRSGTRQATPAVASSVMPGACTREHAQSTVQEGRGVRTR